MSLNFDDFISFENQFELGHLTTESLHSKSKNLSQVVKANTKDAINILTDIDKDCLDNLKQNHKKIFNLQRVCSKTFEDGHKVYLVGCGATGRLSLSLEKIFREKFNSDQVISFMAGGDYALIKSVESFEDSFEYGARQLNDLGFTENDLLIAITEGGETSFVIGALEEANRISSQKPYFLYCNPDSELLKVTRSRRVLENLEIVKLNLTTGPMAISGSTRMQATTVQMIAVGFAINYTHKNISEFKVDFDYFLDELESVNLDFLSKYIDREARIYKEGGHITYIADDDIAISILTDTTERSPTFNLVGFESSESDKMSLAYLVVSSTIDNSSAWEKVLGREVRGLEWEGLPYKLNKSSIDAFNISESAINKRRLQSQGSHHLFRIENLCDGLRFDLEGTNYFISLDKKDLFFKHLLLKLILNTHSTLVMGKLGRYEGNMMTYVRASNYKLINRAVRYVEILLDREKIKYDHLNVVRVLFSEIEKGGDGPIVLRAFEILKN